MTLFMELTVPSVMDEGIIIDKFRENMDEELGILERQFDKTYKTWSEKSKPEWTKDRGRAMGRDLDAAIFTRDFPYVWVNHGTSRGQVKFSDDYRAMTTPRVIGSKQRKGRVLFRGKFAPFTRGIKARNFDDEIAKRRQPLFVKKMQKRAAINLKKFIRHGPTGQKQVIVL